MGLLDLPSPLWSALHRALGWMPGALEVALWAALSSAACMLLYRRLSRQSELHELKQRVDVAMREIGTYEGPFDGLLALIRRALGLVLRQLRLTLIPAVLSSLPMLFVLPWLSNTFEYALPPAGSEMIIELAPAAASLRWPDTAAAAEQGAGRWSIRWPSAAPGGPSPAGVTDAQGVPLFSLPLEIPVPVIHKRGAWNLLVGNPAGYLPDGASVDVVSFAFPEQRLLPFGPAWMGHWLFTFAVVCVAVSLALKLRYRIA